MPDFRPPQVEPASTTTAGVVTADVSPATGSYLEAITQQGLNENGQLNTSYTSFTVQQTGDTYGTTSLSLRNRSGQNGAYVMQGASNLPCDLLVGNANNFVNSRVEVRGFAFISSANTGAEWQCFNQSTKYTLFSGNNVSGSLTKWQTPAALPTIITLTSGTAWQNTTGGDVTVNFDVILNPTSSAAANALVTLGTTSSNGVQVNNPSRASGLTSGDVASVSVLVRNGAYLTVTLTNASLVANGSGNAAYY